MTDIQKHSGHTPARDKAMLALRRRGMSPDRIAEELGIENGFEVRERLNDIYIELNSKMPSGFKSNIHEIIDYVDNQIDDLVTVYKELAMDGDHKAARLVLQGVELKAKIHGAVSAPQVNIQVSAEKPWANVYKTTARPAHEDEREAITGEVVENDDQGYNFGYPDGDGVHSDESYNP